MAAACYRATGSLAVCCGESGPGSHNLVGGLGSAYNNNVPLLVIVSGVPRHVGYPFAGLAMETDNERLLAACTKWTAVVRDASRIDELVQRAIREALSGRPGPVALELPADVLAGEAEFDGAAIAPTRFSSPGGPAGAPELIERAAGLLASAERPLLLAGGGVVAAAADTPGAGCRRAPRGRRDVHPDGPRRDLDRVTRASSVTEASSAARPSCVPAARPTSCWPSGCASHRGGGMEARPQSAAGPISS